MVQLSSKQSRHSIRETMQRNFTMPAILAKSVSFALLNIWHDELNWLFEVNLITRKTISNYPPFFIIPKTIVFYRGCEICMLHVSLSPVLTTLNISGARFPFWIVLLSHTEPFSC